MCALEIRQTYGQTKVPTARQLALEPWREVTHRQLVRALVMDGQRGAALAQCETCRRVLANEWSAEPARDGCPGRTHQQASASAG